MNAKKFLSGIMVCVLAFGFTVPSFAAERNTHELIYQNDASYEISIPATSNIDIATGRGEIDLSITNTKLEDWTVVAITASSANYADGSWNLVNTKNNKDTISYSIGTTVGANDIASGDRVVTASDVTDATLYVTVENADKVGTFSDIITFTSEITVDLIEFSLCIDEHSETRYFFAANGMNWEDWIVSEYNSFDKEKYRLGVNNVGDVEIIYIPGNNYFLGNVQDNYLIPVESTDIIEATDYYVYREVFMPF